MPAPLPFASSLQSSPFSSPLYSPDFKEEDDSAPQRRKAGTSSATHGSFHYQLSPLQLSTLPSPPSSSVRPSTSPPLPPSSSSPSLYSSPFASSPPPWQSGGGGPLPMSPLLLPHGPSASASPSSRPSTAPPGRPSPSSSPLPISAFQPPDSFPRRLSLLELSGSASPLWSPTASPPLPPTLSLDAGPRARQRPPEPLSLDDEGPRKAWPQPRRPRRTTAAPLLATQTARWLLTGLVLALLLYGLWVHATSAPAQPPTPMAADGAEASAFHARADAMLRQQVDEYQQHMRQHQREDSSRVRSARRGAAVEAEVEAALQRRVGAAGDGSILPVHSVGAKAAASAVERDEGRQMHVVDAEVWRKR